MLILVSPVEVREVSTLVSDVLMMTSTLTHQAKQYIERSLPDVDDVQSVARALGVSPCELDKEFEYHEGDTIAQYILRCRVASMRLDIRLTDLPESAIVERAGFDDIEQARRAFRQATGRTMSAYRDQHRDEEAPE